MVAHYVALNPIVCLLVASINRPLSGCSNQNDSNTGSVMTPLSTDGGRERAERGGQQKERGEEKTRGKRRGPIHVIRGRNNDDTGRIRAPSSRIQTEAPGGKNQKGNSAECLDSSDEQLFSSALVR